MNSRYTPATYPIPDLHLDPQPWMREAVCTSTDPELFFPPSGANQKSVAAAKRICSTCPVATECLEYGKHELYGIYGGRSVKERRRLPKPRRSTCKNGHRLAGPGPCVECRRAAQRRYHQKRRQAS